MTYLPLFVCFAALVGFEAAFAEPRFAGTTVRVLLVFDQNAQNVGKPIREGSAVFIEALKDIRSRLGSDGAMTIDLMGMTDQPVRPEAILNYYRNLSIARNDALFFYYNGHGATDKHQGHFFAMSGGDLLRSDVLEAMQALQPRLTVMASDACSSLSRYDDGTKEVPYTALKVESDGRNVFRDLFFNETGIVDFTAAQAPQYAWAPHGGGIFTLTLARLLNGTNRAVDVDGDGVIVWNEFLRSVRWEVRTSFEKLKANGHRLSAFGEVASSTEQTPELFKFPSFGPNQPVQLLNMKAVVDDVKVGDASGEGKAGYSLLTVDAKIWNAQGRKIRLEAHFRDENGFAIKATDRRFADVDGFLASWWDATATLERTRFSSVKLYFPNNAIQGLAARAGVYINVRDLETHALLGGSPFLLLPR